MIFNPPMLTIDSVGKLSNVPACLIIDVMNAFTLPNPKHAEAKKRNAFAAQKIPAYLKYYSFDGDYISFPRGATRVVLELCQKRGVKLVLNDRRVSRPLEKKINFTSKLRNYQQESSDAAISNDFGVIEASTGAGKTVIACDLIARRSVNTIIVIPSVDLLFQWVERLTQHTDLKKEDIGLLGDGICDIKPITVAIINTLAKHSKELENYFEYLIIDEAHRVAAEMYVGGPLTSLATKSMTGLSATLMRGDGLIDLLYWFVGRVVHKVDPRRLREEGAVMKPLVCQKDTGFISKQAEKSYTTMISEMVDDNERNTLIADNVIADARWRAGQGGGGGLVLVVSDRVGHLGKLTELIGARLGEKEVVLLHGKVSSKKRKEIVASLEKGEVLVLAASLSLIAEGFDAKTLSSCHFATPITDRKRVIQTAGRILRPLEGKIPTIIDYVDRRIGMLDYRAQQRLEIFKKDVFATPVKVPPWSQEKRPDRRQPEKQKTEWRQPERIQPGRTQRSLFDVGVAA